MNKYEIVKTLGQGGYGKANLVRRKTDKKLFVEKEVRLTSLGPKDREGAIQEAKLLASLRHPYIVEYEESFQERGNLYIVMGYADGGDLSKKIESRGNRLFTEDEILHDFIEVALAIKYIHDRKICHRDLKGQNIFLTKDGTIKLGDFGISKILEHTFQACRTQIGTPFYLSPEICQGRNYNTKTDIWSLGCILYELCTLKHAFNAPNMKQLMMNIIQARYTPIPSQYSQDLRSLVDRMLTKEPDRRPTINQILNTPYIKKQLSNFLEKTLLEYEMGHTRLHNRKPFAPPTIVISKDPAPQPKPSQPQRERASSNDNHNDYKEKQRLYEAQQKQLQMKEAALRKREAEIAARERNLANQQKQNNNYNRGGGGGYQSDEDEYRARQYYEQKRAMLENKARMQQEMSGNNMKYAIQNQFARGKKKDDDYYYSYSYSDEDDNSKYNKKGNNKNQNQSNYEQQARENYFEKLRMVRANRERMKREELQGGEMQRALMQAQVDDDDDRNQRNNRNDNRQDKRKGGNDNFDAINAYMRQQRHEAAENKRRLEEAERGSAAKAAMAQPSENTSHTKHKTIKRKANPTSKYDYDYYSDYYSDYSDPPPQKKPQQPPQKSPQQPQQPQQKQKPKDDVNAINEYMRQLRHEREANKLRALEAEKKAKQEEDMQKRAQPQQPPPSQPPSKQGSQPPPDYESDDEPPPQKEKKVEMSQAERNAYMREERHRRRANKARIEAMGRINMDQLIAEAEAEQRANPRLDDSIKQDNKDSQPAEAEVDNEPLPQKEKKVEMSQAERNAYMREERHQRRANKARIEAMGRINMDQLIAEAEAEQRANPKLDDPKKENSSNNNPESRPSPEEENEPPPQKEKKVEMTQAERNAYMREERHKRRENKARIEAMGKIDMDQLIAQAEAEQRANPAAALQQPQSKPAESIQPKQQQPPQKQQQPSKPSSSNDESKSKNQQQKSEMPKKSPRLLGEEVKDALKSGRFKANQQEGSKMTVAEAKKKQQQQQQQQQQDQKQRGSSPSVSGQQGPLLDKNKMKELFQQKREGIRQNREKIKAAQDGSRDPSLLVPSSGTKSTSKAPIGRLLKDSVSGRVSTNTGGSTGSTDSSGSVRRKQRSMKPDMHSATFKEEVPSEEPLDNKDKDKSGSLRKKKRRSKDKEKDKTANQEESPKLDLSQALNSKSTSEFLKSRSIVLDNIALQEGENENENDNNDQQSLDEIKERADIINAALDIKEEDLQDDVDDNGNDANNGENGGTSSSGMNNGVDYYLRNKGVNLPAISDKDSISYRAEAIRAFLEKKIGIDKVVGLKKAALNENGNGDEEGDNIFKGMEPGLIALARYLFMLDETFE